MKLARAVALTGVLVTAVLMVVLVRPAMREIIGWQGQPWLGVLILGAPTVALLTATGYRYYGPRRALTVALVVTVISGIVSALSTLFAVGAAHMPSGSAILVLGLAYGTPFVSVLAIGGLALRIAAPANR